MDHLHIVTGGSGFIGRYLVRELRESKQSVWVIARDKEKAIRILGEETPNFRIILSDLMEIPHILEKEDLSGLSVDFWHLAANLTFSKKEKKNSWNTNYEGTKSVLSYLSQIKSARIIYMSTAYVAAFRNPQEARKNVYSSPSNIYEKGKQAAEKLIRTSSVPHVIIRPTIVLGEAYSGKGIGCTFGYYRFAYIFGIFKRWLTKNKNLTHWIDPFCFSWLIIPVPSGTTVNFVALEDLISLCGNVAESRTLKDKTYTIGDQDPLLVKNGFGLILEDMGFRNYKFWTVSSSFFSFIAKVGAVIPSPWKKYCISAVEYLPYMNTNLTFGPSDEIPSASTQTSIDKPFLQKVNQDAINRFWSDEPCNQIDSIADLSKNEAHCPESIKIDRDQAERDKRN